MRLKKIVSLVSSLALMALLTMSAASCQASGKIIDPYDVSGGVAAVVNDVEIGENVVNTYIEYLRNDQGATDDKAWGEWLVSHGYSDVKKFRDDLVNRLVEEEVLLQLGKEYGIELPDKELETAIETSKDRAKEEFPDEDDSYQAWLNEWGLYTEEMLIRTLRISWIQNEFTNGEILEVEDPTEKQIIDLLTSYKDMINDARRSSHILFEANDKDNANKILNQINSGEIPFEDAAVQYSIDTGSAQNGGDVGWDKLTTFVEEYQSALSALGKGEVSGLVESQFGWHIIKCTDTYTFPESLTTLDGVPDDFINLAKTDLSQSNITAAYEKAIADFKEKSSIEIKDAPEKLPYWVDLTGVEVTNPENYVEMSTEDSTNESSSDEGNTDGETDGK